MFVYYVGLCVSLSMCAMLTTVIKVNIPFLDHSARVVQLDRLDIFRVSHSPHTQTHLTHCSLGLGISGKTKT